MMHKGMVVKKSSHSPQGKSRGSGLKISKDVYTNTSSANRQTLPMSKGVAKSVSSGIPMHQGAKDTAKGVNFLKRKGGM